MPSRIDNARNKLAPFIATIARATSEMVRSASTPVFLRALDKMRHYCGINRDQGNGTDEDIQRHLAMGHAGMVGCDS